MRDEDLVLVRGGEVLDSRNFLRFGGKGPNGVFMLARGTGFDPEAIALDGVVDVEGRLLALTDDDVVVEAGAGMVIGGVQGMG